MQPQIFIFIYTLHCGFPL